MDLQIYNINNEEIRDSLPTMKYTIQVVSRKENLDIHLSKIKQNFINNIKDGDMVLIEHPPIPMKKYTGGIYDFSIKVTNLMNNECISFRSGKIYDEFWNCLSRIKVIE